MYSGCVHEARRTHAQISFVKGLFSVTKAIYINLNQTKLDKVWETLYVWKKRDTHQFEKHYSKWTWWLVARPQIRNLTTPSWPVKFCLCRRFSEPNSKHSGSCPYKTVFKVESIGSIQYWYVIICTIIQHYQCKRLDFRLRRDGNWTLNCM